MTNQQMIAGRFLRWARVRRQYAWIVAQIDAGRTVYLTTSIRSTKIAAKHLPMVRAAKTGLMIQSGKHWIDYSLAKITAA